MLAPLGTVSSTDKAPLCHLFKCTCEFCVFFTQFRLCQGVMSSLLLITEAGEKITAATVAAMNPFKTGNHPALAPQS